MAPLLLCLPHSKPSCSAPQMFTAIPNRWFSGQMYERLGFKLDAEVQATYYYVTASSKTRMSKALFQRKFLPEKLAVFDPNLSERENCERNGLYQIHDAGKRRWLWTRI